MSPVTLDPPYHAFASSPSKRSSPPMLGFSFTFLKLLPSCAQLPLLLSCHPPRSSFEFSLGPPGPDCFVAPHLRFPEALQLLGHSSQVADARTKSTLYHAYRQSSDFSCVLNVVISELRLAYARQFAICTPLTCLLVDLRTRWQ